MTASPFSASSPAPCPTSPPVSAADSTAQLMTRFTGRLRTRLGGPRPAAGPPRRAGTPVPTLVAVAHGSRDPAALRTVRALLARVRELRPGLRVALGHIELNDPLLPRTLARIDPAEGPAVLVPLLFGPGYHVEHDIPRALATAPRLRATVAAPLGPHPLLAAALHDRLAEAGWNQALREHALRNHALSNQALRPAVVLAAAGSRDPESAASTRCTAAQLALRLGGGVPVLPAYASAAAPSVEDAVRELRARDHAPIALASCFTAPGRFAARCAAAVPRLAAAPVGPHPDLARLVLHRYDEVCAYEEAGAYDEARGYDDARAYDQQPPRP